MKNKTLWPQPK